MATIFALVQTPKEQHKGSAIKTTANNNVDKPKYETELAVTQALVKGELDGFDSFDAYAKAKAWQKHLKAIQPRFFAHKVAKPTPPNKYMHVMFQR